MRVSNVVAEMMQMQCFAAEMNLLAAEVLVLARKLQEQKRQTRQKTFVFVGEIFYSQKTALWSV